MDVLRYLVKNDMAYIGYAYAIKGSKNAVHIDVRVPQSTTTKRWKGGYK